MIMRTTVQKQEKRKQLKSNCAIVSNFHEVTFEGSFERVEGWNRLFQDHDVGQQYETICPLRTDKILVRSEDVDLQIKDEPD